MVTVRQSVYKVSKTGWVSLAPAWNFSRKTNRVWLGLEMVELSSDYFFNRD